MSEQTNKELLRIIHEQTRRNAEEQLSFAGRVSTFINEQKDFNKEVMMYLESNDKTNQKGLVEQVKVNTDDINQIKIDKKVDKAKIGVVGVMIGAVITFLSKILF